MLSANFSKRKARGSADSTSSMDSETMSPEMKKQKEQTPTGKEKATTDEVLFALDFAQKFASKIDLIMEKLGKLDNIETQLNSLQDSVNQTNVTVQKMQQEISTLKLETARTANKTNDLEKSLNFFGKTIDEEKQKVEEINESYKEEISKLNLQLLKHETYTRRENLRFYGIPESNDENAENTLYDFIENQLKVSHSDGIEFQRIHRTGRRKHGQPRPIIARFLRFQDRERVFESRSKLNKEDGYGVGVDLPPQVIEIRKTLIPKMLEARKNGRKASFSKSEPYKLFIDGELAS